MRKYYAALYTLTAAAAAFAFAVLVVIPKMYYG